MVSPRNRLAHYEDDRPGDWGFEGARRFALELALRMTPAERLGWLEDTMVEMRSLCGLADPKRAQSSR